MAGDCGWIKLPLTHRQKHVSLTVVCLPKLVERQGLPFLRNIL